MGKRRVEVRPRYGRLLAALSSCGVTVVAVLGGSGLLPSAADAPAAERPAYSPAAAPEAAPGRPTGRASERATRAERRVVSPDSTPGERVVTSELLPAESGTGRRVVFSESAQRVWLVSERDTVRRTYLVSGSIYDNLEPGTFSVYSRSMDAVGIEDSGTMKLFVRFTQGDSGAAIGFHDIPVDDGDRVQTLDQLGTALSHGCIRQRRADARAMWDFAPLGTPVVVTA